MTRYVALLRGINVGGHRRVPMAELRQVMTGLGWDSVATHLNSGNAVFSAGEAEPAALAGALEAALAEHFGFPVDCLVRSGQEMRDAQRRCPWPTADRDPAKLLVLFADRPVPAEALAGVDAARYAPDEFQADGREVYCWFPDGMGRSKLPDAVTAATRGLVLTGRNWRTVAKLVEMSS
ncbi:DUF1697 domain-containing protein [Streptomyces sp. 549]|uniref:DUF1697 domain-containing protein n=1 Tax=Streptomyces sp. 549 TaxID=3049076 RepID=UPI0032E36730